MAAQRDQPLGERLRALEFSAPRVDLLAQRNDFRLVLRLVATRLTPLPHAKAAQPAFELRQCGHRLFRQVLEPIEHIITRRMPRRSTQGHHDLRGLAGGGQRPAVLVLDLHARLFKQGDDAARERTIGGRERDGNMSNGQMLNHAGGSQLRLVLRIERLMQSDELRGLVHLGRKRLGQRNRQTRIAPVRKQGLREWIGMKTFQCNQHVHGIAHAFAKQHICGRIGGQHPFQRDLGGGGFQLQRLRRHRQIQMRASGFGPGLALIGRHRRRERGKLLRHLQHQAKHGVGLRAKTCRFEQASPGQRVAGHIELKTAVRWRLGAQRGRPVARGFEARHEAVGEQRRPLLLGLRHQLRIGNKHHDACRMHAARSRFLCYTCEHMLPALGHQIVCRYYCHSILLRGHTVMRGISFCHNDP